MIILVVWRDVQTTGSGSLLQHSEGVSAAGNRSRPLPMGRGPKKKSLSWDQWEYRPRPETRASVRLSDVKRFNSGGEKAWNSEEQRPSGAELSERRRVGDHMGSEFAAVRHRKERYGRNERLGETISLGMTSKKVSKETGSEWEKELRWSTPQSAANRDEGVLT